MRLLPTLLGALSRCYRHPFPLRLLLLTAGGAVLTGCAGLDVQRVASDHPNSTGLNDAHANGIRYYEPANFLLVYSDGAGSVKTDILVLPDTTRKMTAKPHQFLSKNKQVLTFADGMLGDVAQTVDTTIVPAALIQAAQNAAEAAAKAGLFNAPAANTPQRAALQAPHLYKIVVHGNTVTLLGSSAADSITLPLTGS